MHHGPRWGQGSKDGVPLYVTGRDTGGRPLVWICVVFSFNFWALFKFEVGWFGSPKSQDTFVSVLCFLIICFKHCWTVTVICTTVHWLTLYVDKSTIHGYSGQFLPTLPACHDSLSCMLLKTMDLFLSENIYSTRQETMFLTMFFSMKFIKVAKCPLNQSTVYSSDLKQWWLCHWQLEPWPCPCHSWRSQALSCLSANIGKCGSFHVRASGEENWERIRGLEHWLRLVVWNIFYVPIYWE